MLEMIMRRELPKSYLAKEFEIKVLGRLKWFFGIEVAHSKENIFISQKICVTYLFKETCKPPIDPNLRLEMTKEDVAVDKKMY